MAKENGGVVAGQVDERLLLLHESRNTKRHKQVLRNDNAEERIAWLQ